VIIHVFDRILFFRELPGDDIVVHSDDIVPTFFPLGFLLTYFCAFHSLDVQLSTRS
jgi:hypothetical protein